MKPPKRNAYSTQELDDLTDQLVEDPARISEWIRVGSNSGDPVPQLVYDWQDALQAMHDRANDQIPTFGTSVRIIVAVALTLVSLLGLSFASVYAAALSIIGLGAAGFTIYDAVKGSKQESNALTRRESIERAQTILEQEEQRM